MNCAQFASAQANSNFPQRKRERTYYARTWRRNFARPGPRDVAPSRSGPPNPSGGYCPGLFTFCLPLFTFVYLCLPLFTIKKYPGGGRGGAASRLRVRNRRKSHAIQTVHTKTFGHSKDSRLVPLCSALFHLKFLTHAPLPARARHFRHIRHFGHFAAPENPGKTPIPSLPSHFFPPFFSTVATFQPLSLPIRRNSIAFGLRPEKIIESMRLC